MFADRHLSIRPANPADHNALLALIRYEERVHVHLDWKNAEDWLGAQPFLLAERGRRAMGALACPPNPPDTAWLRLFVAADDTRTGEIWQALWERARAMLVAMHVQRLAVLCLEAWVADLCVTAGFALVHSVVVLVRRLAGPAQPNPARLPPGLVIRPAGLAEVEAIAEADLAAFASPWQVSAELTRLAILRADWLTVAEAQGKVVGYQLSTLSPTGAHLARLAVLPAWQGQGVGAALVAEAISHYQGSGVAELTVNTQDSNAASLRLYQRLGFVLTNTRYPVYQCEL